jgi:DNA polymerase
MFVMSGHAPQSPQALVHARAARTSHAPSQRSGGRVRAADLTTLADLDTQARACTLCRLCTDRTQVVGGAGPTDADVLVVLDAPGYQDDRTGQLLSGDPGVLLDEVLALAGRTRDQVYVTSVVKCRPPAGRAPFPDEIEACEGWLFRELALVRPNVVVTLGSLALRLVTARQDRLRDVHGTMLHVQAQGRDVVVWPLYHPAAAVQIPQLADELRTDARSLGRLLRGAASVQRPVVSVDADAPVAAPTAPAQSQMSFDL